MYDKIGAIEAEIRNVVRDKRLTQVEKFELVKQKSRMLSETERKVLLKKCQRSRDIYTRSQDLKDILYLFVSWIGTFFVIFGIYADNKGKPMPSGVYAELLGCALIYGIITIMGLSIIQTWKNKNWYITQYMIDVLEDE